MTRLWRTLVLVFAVLTIFGCGGLNYSQCGPQAENFHPKSLVILPVVAGDFELARKDSSDVLLKVVSDTGWFTEVTQPDFASLAPGASEASALSNDLANYVLKLTTAGYSDPQLCGRLGTALHGEALLLCRITAWGYTRQDGDKLGKVGMWMKLLDPKSGSVVWTASHEVATSYWLFKPDLKDVCLKCARMMVKEMPH